MAVLKFENKVTIEARVKSAALHNLYNRMLVADYHQPKFTDWIRTWITTCGILNHELCNQNEDQCMIEAAFFRRQNILPL